MQRWLLALIASFCIVTPAMAQGTFFKPNRSVADLTAQVESLGTKTAQAIARGDYAAAGDATAAQQGLLQELTSIEPRNPRWKMMTAITYINQAGGPSCSGMTAGNRVGLKLAIRELDAALACPGVDKYRAQITQLRADTAQELARREARGRGIKQAGARNFAKNYALPSPKGGKPCAGCGHWKTDASDRCPWCGAF